MIKISLSGYWWIRIYDYDWDRDRYDKGILLDEYYLKDIFDRNQAKDEVYKKYGSKLPLRKPKLPSGSDYTKEELNTGFKCVYAVFMESDKFFYDRFCLEIDTYCFDPDCHKHIHGKMIDLPYTYKCNYESTDDFEKDNDEKIYFCSYDCKYRFQNRLKGFDGEWQSREDYNTNGGVFGYIYCIYNRVEDFYYVGQTRYMPFFRWQEHIKSGLKGDIHDLTFSVIAEVKYQNGKSDSENQELLNNIEAWWIRDYIEMYGKDRVKNLTVPKLTFKDYENLFDKMIHDKKC